MKSDILIIGHTFPEPTTTAAGGRMMQLIQFFSEEGFQIHFASTASISDKSAHLDSIGIKSHSIKLNDVSFDTFLGKINPEIVLFDRFITEEQFGWRVAENCPKAIRILDTEDLHFLRKAREEAVKKDINVEDAFLYTETAKRELASILRCDLSLIISKFEIELLQTTFKIPAEILLYLPFSIEIEDLEKLPNLPLFNERKDFVAIGNLLHAPNVDSVEILKREVWPRIRKEIPTARLHIYGAYAPQRILQLHNEKEGFLLKGWAESVEEVMQNAKICLAPLRFGAGLKGKLFDAVLNGCPFITTKIGAEGMVYSKEESFIKDDFHEFAKAAISCYVQQKKWIEAQKIQRDSIFQNFKRENFIETLKSKIYFLQINLDTHRQENFIGQILQHQSLLSTKYLSKWIEAKNK